MSTAKIWIAAAIVLVVGIVLCAIGFVASGFHIGQVLNTTEYTEQTFSTDASEVTRIVVDSRNTMIKIQEGSSSQAEIEVVYHENKYSTYEVEVSGSELHLTRTETRKWFEWIGIDIHSDTGIVITVPAGYQGSYSIDSGNAPLVLTDLSLTEKDSVFSTSNSTITAQNLSGGTSVTLSSSNGAIRVDDSTFPGDVLLHSSNSGLTLSNCTVSGDAELTTSMGKITVEQVSVDGSLTVDTSNAAINLTNLDCAGKLDVKTSNGTINLDTVSSSERIRLRSSNGAIKGTLVGTLSDYAVTSDTSNGDNNLPTHSDGDIPLDVDTSNAKIDIEFLG